MTVKISSASRVHVADAILHLSARRISERQLRELEGSKAPRLGLPHGETRLPASSDGVAVFPRLADPAEEGACNLDDGKRISSGIDALDTMLADGYWPGASTLIAGPSGCGKTLLGLHFIFGGARSGEPGLIATLQENPTQLERVVRSFDWSLEEDAVDVMYRSPVDIYIDQWFHELREGRRRPGASGPMDSLDDLGFTTQDEVTFASTCIRPARPALREEIKVSLMMTLEVPNIARVTHLSEFNISHLADNVVLLQYVWSGAHVKRALTVRNPARARSTRPSVKFKIQPDGIVLGDERRVRSRCRSGSDPVRSGCPGG